MPQAAFVTVHECTGDSSHSGTADGTQAASQSQGLRQRTLRSRSAVKTRGTLLHCERPLVHAIGSAHLSRVCTYCCRDVSLEHGASLMRCKGCSLAHYCGRTCYESDWKLHHRRECRSIAALKERLVLRPGPESGRPRVSHAAMNAKVTDNVRMMARLLRLRCATGDKSASSFGDQWSRFERMLSNRDLQTERHLVELRTLAQLVLEFIAGARLEDEQDILRRFSHDAIVDYFCKFKTNSFALCNQEMNPVGSALYVGNVSSMNHSCQPNCVAVFGAHGEIQVRNIEPVDAGEELTISYIPLCQARRTRRAKLHGQYCFDCRCQRCQNDDQCDTEDAHLLGKVRRERSEGNTAVATDDGHRSAVSEALAAMEEAQGDDLHVRQTRLSLRNLLRDLDPCNEAVNDLAQKLLKMAIERQSFVEAAALCKLVILPYRMLHNINGEKTGAFRFDPLLGMNWYTLGKLQWFLERSEEALRSFEAARDILSVTHGSNAALVTAVTRQVQEAAAEAAMKRRHQRRRGHEGHCPPPAGDGGVRIEEVE